MTRLHTPLLPLFIALTLTACADAAPSEEARGEWRAETETRGDTTVVRTLGGSVWGDTMVLVPEAAIGVMEGEEPYIFGSIASVEEDPNGRLLVVDGQARQVRVFSPQGAHLLSIGRAGQGPGEFTLPDAARVMRDGRIVVRNHPYRFAVFSPQGEFLDQWRYAGTFATNAPFYVDAQDHLLIQILRDRLVRFALDGTPLDTIAVPTRGYERQEVTVRDEAGRMSATFAVPYSPAEVWTITSAGAIAFGISERYSIDLTDPSGRVLRVERSVTPVPVAEGERRQRQETLTRQVRSNAPDWSMQGVEVPAAKPAFRMLQSGRDGTLWVFRHSISSEEANPDHDPSNPDSHATTWREPMIADVFDEQGRYLGPVKFPAEMGIASARVLRADRVLAGTTHPDGYPQVVRYRLAKKSEQES